MLLIYIVFILSVKIPEAFSLQSEDLLFNEDRVDCVDLSFDIKEFKQEAFAKLEKIKLQ